MANSSETQHPVKAFGWAARDTTGVLSPFKFSRRATGDDDVRFKVLYCGICHSDLHMIKNEWGFTKYPVVPGHEIVGVVTEVGSKVEKVKVGDNVGIGVLVGSCRSCDSCGDNMENHCAKQVMSYGSRYSDGTITHGGYSESMVADQHFVVRWPDNLPLDSGAPLLCAGITTYSPLKYFALDKPGTKVGVVGLGGLGHLAVKLAKAFGAHVTVISTSESKKKEALEKLGADSFLISREPEQMQGAMNSLDGIIDTVSATHPLAPLLGLLKPNGKLVMVGGPEKPLELPVFPLLMGRKIIAGSIIGGLKETQEMLDFAAKHNITADVEVIPMDYVNTAMERLVKSDVRYRHQSLNRDGYSGAPLLCAGITTYSPLKYFGLTKVGVVGLETQHPVKAFGWAATDTTGVLSPFKFSRRTTGDNDVRFKVLYCGICHSDLHMIKNEWGFTQYPVVPGHEIVGVVTEVGSKVEKFKVGDNVGVGCLVGSCRSCDSCCDNMENHCAKQVLTYGAPHFDGTITHGGYSESMVADEHFILRWPENLPLDSGAPLLCAGITTYSPLKYFALDKPGTKVGVVGLGGLGHLAVKLAKAFGAHVTVISTSESKKKEALEKLGADSFLISRDPEQMQGAMNSLDGIIDTVSATHPLAPLLGLLKPNGKLVMVGGPEKPLELPVFPLLMGRKILAGSNIGGLKETQEMLDFAAKHNITADVEVISMDYVNTAMERLVKSDVRYRFVIDVANTLKTE
ncbi:hypothetical protein POM88_003770 [Heracleum sosnowskyi]|uniref:Mannitol dehydrogenase n=1 Tax=Heracleum sosnowskyi TaxID=360622 RepID=A0AAD8JGL2_9APIA|nr:hypothetical protein POM88_003770 [Heracleum sosnowskyi]